MTSVPNPIEFDSQVFSLAFHPTEDIVASGLIEGDVHCHRYALDSPAVALWSSKTHKESCRALSFGVDGAALFSGSKDKSLQVIDVETGKVMLKKPKAHSEPLNALLALNAQLLASGDDGGCIKIWDTRQRKVAMKYHENVDFISDLTFVEHKKTLLATSGDGCLTVMDIRKSKSVAVSANQDDELLCVQVVRNTTKAVVGTQDGTLLLFSWGDWGDCTDRFPGHPNSVDSMVKVEDATVMTASGDGIIRAIGILPNRLVGAVGEHGDMPIESIRLSRDGELVGSCSHDATVRFWSVAEALKEDEDEEEEDAEQAEEDAEQGEDEENNDHPANEDSDDDAPESDHEDAAGTSSGKRKPASESDANSSDSDAPEKKEKARKKKSKKAKRGIGGGKKANAAFFADID